MRATDRRQGLPNLFWLAHTRDVAEALRELEAKSPPIRKLKYSLHPLLSSFYRRLEQAVRARAASRAIRPAPPSTTGARENGGLDRALLEDGFAFTELSIAEFDFNLFLASNKRYRLPADVFFEIYTILCARRSGGCARTTAACSRGSPATCPSCPRSSCQTQAGVVKVMMNTHVMTYLLGDVWQTGSQAAGLGAAQGGGGAPAAGRDDRRLPRPGDGGEAVRDPLATLRDRVIAPARVRRRRGLEDKESRGAASSSSATRPRC